MRRVIGRVDETGSVADGAVTRLHDLAVELCWCADRVCELADELTGCDCHEEGW